ncbi:MAG: cytochrome C, partial [Ottowia sp.]|nr:cytochrome C [Ottowia sp.]
WKTGQRKALTPDCVTSVVRRLSDADALAVVPWVAAQPVPAETAPAAVPPASAPPPPELRCGSAPLPGATP